MAYGVNDNIDLDIILDNSEITCIDTFDLHHHKDFAIKFSTTAYYHQKPPGLTVLVCIRSHDNNMISTEGAVRRGRYAKSPGLH